MVDICTRTFEKAAALFLCACMAGTSVDLTAFTVHAQEQTATEEKVEAEKTEQPEITDETTEDAQKSEVQTEAVNQEEEQSVSTYSAISRVNRKSRYWVHRMESQS